MTEKKNIHAGHRNRLKRKLLNMDSENFEPHEALEILLFYALPQKNTNPIAHELLQKFGSLSGVLEADLSDLIKVNGIKEHSATLIKLQLAMFRMYMQDKYEIKNMKITPDNAGDYIKRLFLGYNHEVLFAIMLDADFSLISTEKITEGTNNGTGIYSREIMSKALETNASNIILAHNHPNGLLIPSAADLNATRVIENGLSFINVRLVDHVIVANNKFTSILNKLGQLNYVHEYEESEYMPEEDAEFNEELFWQ
ncbi:MAG: DNA repair protein RadC [Eubacteriales bacterium]|nr:DNA repair protein RadC [Eubacteriales bacterium]